MDELEKLLNKANTRNRRKILLVMKRLRAGQTKGFQYQKLKDSNLYKVRVGKYRVIFSFSKDKTIKIDAVRLRNEDTYK